LRRYKAGIGQTNRAYIYVEWLVSRRAINVDEEPATQILDRITLKGSSLSEKIILQVPVELLVLQLHFQAGDRWCGSSHERCQELLSLAVVAALVAQMTEWFEKIIVGRISRSIIEAMAVNICHSRYQLILHSRKLHLGSERPSLSEA
jgi:hypothetical protein